MSSPASRVASVDLRDYRNLTRVALELPPRGLALVGDNGQGKTNFLEAIYYFQLLRSARGSRDLDCVRFGTDGFSLHGELAGARGVSMGVGFERSSRKKRIRLDGVATPRLSDALGMLPAVMVSPADATLVSGEPASRRRYMDVLLALTSRRYLNALQGYRHALQQRNATIRELNRAGRSDEESVAVWEPALARHGATLVAERREWVLDLRGRYAELCEGIGERGTAAMRYDGALADEPDAEAALVAVLGSRRSMDLRRGATTAGPHRDSLALTLDRRELRTVGSSGQQRTAAVALRLLEAETYQRRLGTAPVLLMDDPFAELDAKRGEAIASVLEACALGQTFLAVPKASDIPSGFSALPRATVNEGMISVTGDE